MNVLNGQESVGIMPQGAPDGPCLSPFMRQFFTDGRPIHPINRAIVAPNW
ncbi:hypothetical protein FBY09_106199 [Pseudomonas sp. SJZ101]|nr:hypothetical protein FBY00_106199 [Pseudomonas sp. SJZ075]TWC19610.1 hypothetical protein FBX99_111107 [Pseudomonas sp. SJZ074]TWC55768.1 hypothetical protein FBY11_10613 [Pseudomonas sp. SJZ124]TWC91621.1 hypothetical protein FBY09_106199 [Pseudomonas sp. SJZ101]